MGCLFIYLFVCRIDDFEFTPERAIFDLLGIELYHGWIVDPQVWIRKLYAAIPPFFFVSFSFNFVFVGLFCELSEFCSTYVLSFYFIRFFMGGILFSPLSLSLTCIGCVMLIQMQVYRTQYTKKHHT